MKICNLRPSVGRKRKLWLAITDVLSLLVNTLYDWSKEALLYWGHSTPSNATRNEEVMQRMMMEKRKLSYCIFWHQRILFAKLCSEKEVALSEEVQDNLEKAFLLTEDVEVKRSSVNAKKLSQKSACVIVWWLCYVYYDVVECNESIRAMTLLGTR